MPDILYQIIKFCGPLYGFQNMLICRDSHNIVVNLLEYNITINHKISTKYSIEYFEFIYNTNYDIEHLFTNDMHLYILDNMNSKLFIYFADTYYWLYEDNLSDYKISIRDDVYAYDTENKCTIMDLIRNYDTNNIELSDKFFIHIKETEKVLDYVYEL